MTIRNGKIILSAVFDGAPKQTVHLPKIPQLGSIPRRFRRRTNDTSYQLSQHNENNYNSTRRLRTNLRNFEAVLPGVGRPLPVRSLFRSTNTPLQHTGVGPFAVIFTGVNVVEQQIRRFVRLNRCPVWERRDAAVAASAHRAAARRRPIWIKNSRFGGGISDYVIQRNVYVPIWNLGAHKTRFLARTSETLQTRLWLTGMRFQDYTVNENLQKKRIIITDALFTRLRLEHDS
jgi:hypothetical protein